MFLRIHKYSVRLFLIALGIVLYFFANLQRVAVPGAVFGLLQQKLSAQAPAITALGASFMYVYAVSQIFMGRIVERYGGLRMTAFGAIFFSLGGIVFPYTHSMLVLYISRAFMGLGAGCFYLSLVRELERCISDKNFGIVLSATIFIGYSGAFAANGPFVWLINRFGFTQTMAGIGLVVLAVSLVFIAVGSQFKLTMVKTDRHIDFASYKQVLCSRQNIILFSYASLNYALMYVLQTVIGKKFLEDFCLFSSLGSSWLLSAMSIISAFSSMGLAFISRQHGGKKAFLFKTSAVISVLDFIFILLTLISGIKINAMMCLAFCTLASMTAMSPLLVIAINETNRHSIIVTAAGVLNAMFFFAVGIFGNITGFMMNLFPPESINGILVYSRNSYLAVFIPLLMFSLAELYFAMKIKESKS